MILDQFGNEMPRSVVMARLISKLHNLSGLLIIPVDEEEARKLIRIILLLISRIREPMMNGQGEIR